MSRTTAVNNITREEAQQRARLLAAASYDVELDLSGAPAGDETFRSTAVIRFTCREPGATTHLDLIADEVLEATLNGAAVPPEAFDGGRLTLSGLAESNELRVVARCRYMNTGEGLHRFHDPVDDATYLYTQFETYDAHRMYACFDQPDLKASFAFTVLAPEGWEVVSNMPGQATAEGPGRRRWVFEPTPRMSTYITAVVAGPYHVVRDEHDGIPLGILCRRSLAEFLDPEELFTVTKQGFDFYHRAFDYRYPWPKYDQCFVPEFNAGAMENAGCITFLEDYVFRSKVTDASYERRAETVLHEMAHMWFGDLVTMRWWDDLWLNESFASYASVLCQVEATRHTSAWTTFANVEKTWAYRQDQLPTTHPIAADIVDIDAVEVNFDGITYAKGASVLKQLVHYVGREEFFRALRSYFRRHEFDNTTLQDLLDALENASGRDLTSWSKDWLQTAGVNTLRPRFEVDGDGRYSAFAVAQEAPAEHPTLRSHRIAVGLYDRTSEGLVRRRRVELDLTGALTEVPALVGEAQPDLLLLNDDDLTYAKIRLDERSLRTLVEHVGELRESLPRALCWAAAWDMVRDAEMPARDYVALVLSGIDAETDIGLVQTLQRLSLQAALLYGDPGDRAAQRRRLAEAALDRLGRAPAGSDVQLAWARAFAAAATGDDHVAVLRGLLDGSTGYDGLAVDTELRWTLLHRLVVLGAAGDEEIAAEERRDATAAGRRHAAGARAGRPSAEAKAQAWHDVVETDELPNAVQASIIGRFAPMDQLELVRPYVDRYFEVVAGLWGSRTSEMAQQLVLGLYPSLFVEPGTVERTDSWLREHEQAPAGLRRLLVECRDGVARALRAQERDRQAGGS